jgi:hypothetical protein
VQGDALICAVGRQGNADQLHLVIFLAGTAVAISTERRASSTNYNKNSRMTFDEFRLSSTAAEPPAGLSMALAGLWWDAKGDWKRAHESAQEDAGREGAWVHAYLHRKEGDRENAAYWYARAGKPVCQEPLDVEWVSIVKALLHRDS